MRGSMRRVKNYLAEHRDQFAWLGLCAFLLVLLVVPAWCRFLGASQEQEPSLYPLDSVAVLAVSGILLVWMALRGRSDMTAALLCGLCYIVTFIPLFAIVYYWHGDTVNFNEPLSKIDALYFTVGTMTTGADPVEPMSEIMRGVVTFQQVVGFLAFSVFLAILLNHLASRRAR